MLSSGSLTSSPTSLFWLTVGILALTIIVVGVGLVTWRTATSRKKIIVTVASRSQILSAPESIRDDLQIRYNDKLVQGNLYVTAIELANAGKTAIKTDDFDGKRSLQFSIDAKIVKHLSTEHSPKSAPTPTIVASSRNFSLAPELITKGEIIEFALLTEGKPTQIETAFSPFGEVRIEIGDREALETRRARYTRILGSTAAVLAVLLIVTQTISVVKLGNQAVSNTNITLYSGQCANLADDVVTAVGGIEVLRDQGDAITGSAAVQPATSRSYRAMLKLIQTELQSINSDYRSISASAGTLGAAANMINVTYKSENNLEKVSKSISKSNISNIDNQLIAIEVELISQSAMPSICQSVK